MAETEEIEITEDEPDVRSWRKEIALSKKRDKRWLKEGKEIQTRYRNEARLKDDDKKPDSFNILWANTEVLRPALYSTVPRPDIRRRFGRKNEPPTSRHVVEILERAASYTFEAANLNTFMIKAVNDMLLPGRGTFRPRYEAVFNEVGEVESEQIIYDSVDWDTLLLGPGESWENLPWIGFKHQLSEDEVEELAPEFVDKLTYDVDAGEKHNTEGTGKEQDVRAFKRVVVYEIWDKETRQVMWLADGYDDEFIKIEPDPLELKGFWPIPEPIYAIESTSSLVPVPEFTQYEALADELEDVTVRMGRITKALRVRGVYDSSMSEMQKLFEAGDNDMIPAEGISRILERGGIEKGIWMFPNETLSSTLLELRQYRSFLIQQIYELTGISDILRGNSNPNETLGAQKMKANFGSQRLSRRQLDVQRFARDALRLTVELIAEKFSNETLAQMTGLNFPTEMEKMQAQQMKQQFEAQQQQIQAQGGQPQPPPPEQAEKVQQALSLPTWEEIRAIMSNDLMREYHVDIETDSTIEADQQADQEALSGLIQGIAQFAHGMEPIIGAGVMSKEAAKKVLVAMFRRYRLGREVEEAIEEDVPDKPEEPNADIIKAELEKAKMELEKAKMGMEQQRMQGEAQLEMEKMKLEQQKVGLEQRKMEMNAQAAQAKAAQEAQFKQQQLAMDAEFREREIELDEAKLRLEREKLILEKDKADKDRVVDRAKFRYQQGRLKVAS